MQAALPGTRRRCRTRSIRLKPPGGEVYFPNGTYVVENLTLPSNVTLAGSSQGKSTLLQKIGADFIASANGTSSGASDNVKNLCFRDLTFQGRGDTHGFSDGRHLLNFNGVTNVLVDHCRFLSPQCNAIHLGSGGGSTERHNQNVVVRNSYFDGIDKTTNAEAIRAIDCEGLWIEGCFLTRFAKSDKAGAIALRPDSNAFHVIKNVRILNNRLLDIGGDKGAICALLPSRTLLSNQPNDILICGNSLETVGNALNLDQAGTISDSTAVMQLELLANSVRSITGRPFILAGVKGVRLKDNRFSECDGDPLIGDTAADDLCQDVELANNIFEKTSRSTGSGLSIFSVNRITLRGNVFLDVGKPDGSYGNAIDFNTGSSTYVFFLDNLFLSPTSPTRTTYAIRKESGHTFSNPENNVFKNNRLIGLGGNDFLTTGTYNRDIQYEETTWTPVIAGDSTAGSNTYNVQSGTFIREGNAIHFRCHVELNTPSGMVGNLVITGLPYPSANVANTQAAAAVAFWKVTLSANYSQLQAIIYPNEQRIQISQAGLGGQAFLRLPVSGVGAGTGFILEGTYFKE